MDMNVDNATGMASSGMDATLTPSVNATETTLLGTPSPEDDAASPPDISVADTMAKIYIAIGTFGMTGNLVVIGVILTSATMRVKLTNKYIVNQSAIDTLCSLFLLLGFATVKDNRVPYAGLRGDVYCLIWQTKAFLWSFLVSSTYNLVTITVERYLAVVHPIWHKTRFRGGATELFTLVCPYIVGVGFTMGLVIGSSTVRDGECLAYSNYRSLTVRRVAGIIVVFTYYFLPIGVLFYCYGRIAMVLKSRVQVEPSNDKTRTAGEAAREERWQRARRNTIKTLALVSLCFVLCWTCNQIYYFMFNLGYPEEYSSYFYHFTVMMVFLNCCVNPVIYFVKYQEFQQAARRVLGLRGAGGSVAAEQTASTAGQ